MNLVYVPAAAPQVITMSIFLAGPSPRDPAEYNWRTEAINILCEFNFAGHVFIPFTEDLSEWDKVGYPNQLAWEAEHLRLADIVVFWVPRDLAVKRDVPVGSSAEFAMRMPAFTTNIEFGAWVGSGKAVLGYPPGAMKLSYMAHHAAERNVPVAHTLERTLEMAVSELGDGSVRSSAERKVPLHIWRLAEFQSWYRNLPAGESLWDVGDALRSKKPHGLPPRSGHDRPWRRGSARPPAGLRFAFKAAAGVTGHAEPFAAADGTVIGGA